MAFALPALTSMMSGGVQPSKRRLPRMLVLSPTRELAMQVEKVMEEYGAVVGLRSLVLYGGVPKHAQAAELKQKNVDCLVATPGRLKDLINDGTCDLCKVQYLVLDEADRMLDMGFEEDVKYIISKCMPKEDGRQSAMFSATWPAAIASIAMEYMMDPVRIYVGFESIAGGDGDGNTVDDSLSANKRVQQNVEVIEDRQRENRMKELIHKYQKKSSGKNPNRILIFALYKKEAERLEYTLKRDGFDVCSLHGNKNQVARTQALADFKSGACSLCVATDVAARGLDIPDVEVVINHTFPLTIEDYVHRIGRTGRAVREKICVCVCAGDFLLIRTLVLNIFLHSSGYTALMCFFIFCSSPLQGKHGISHTFFQPTDKAHAGALQAVMRQAGQTPPEALMKFGSTIKKKEHKLYGNFGPRDGAMKKATKITFDY
jgi:ATP-dependent RNA helicase DBP3